MNRKDLFSGLTRRDFLRASAAATAGLATQWTPGYAAAYAGQGETIRVGLIGCGGRGTGAANNCISSSDGVELVAMADLFPDRLERAKEQLTRRLGDKFKVTPERSFVGFDAYKQVLATDVDLVILATFGEMDEDEAKRHVPKVVRVDAQNRMIGDEPERPGPQMPLHHLHGEPQA